MASRTLDALASQFHDHLKNTKSRTRLEAGAWYPWRSLASIQMLDSRMGLDVAGLQQLIGSGPAIDVGCGDGDVAFFLESLGAHVDAVDFAPSNYNRMEGVRALRQALGSNIGIHAVDLDTRPSLPGSKYGLATMLGVLYHLKNPFLALETLARSARYLYMSTRVAALTPDRKVNFGAYPLAYLVDDRELNDDPTNFWIFSELALKRMVRRAGWNELKYFTTQAAPGPGDPVTEAGDVRAFLLAESRLAGAPGIELGPGWHGLEYGASRWTERRFSASVRVERRLAPATLRFVFQIPEVLITRRPRTILRARLNGVELPPATFASAGEQEYAAAVPSLEAGRAQIEFELDQAVHFENDERELGVQVYFNGPAPLRLA